MEFKQVFLFVVKHLLSFEFDSMKEKEKQLKIFYLIVYLLSHVLFEVQLIQLNFFETFVLVVF